MSPIGLFRVKRSDFLRTKCKRAEDLECTNSITASQMGLTNTFAAALADCERQYSVSLRRAQQATLPSARKKLNQNWPKIAPAGCFGPVLIEFRKKSPDIYLFEMNSCSLSRAHCVVIISLTMVNSIACDICSRDTVMELMIAVSHSESQ
jgi:hypothetical protein